MDLPPNATYVMEETQRLLDLAEECDLTPTQKCVFELSLGIQMLLDHQHDLDALIRESKVGGLSAIRGLKSAQEILEEQLPVLTRYATMYRGGFPFDKPLESRFRDIVAMQPEGYEKPAGYLLLRKLDLDSVITGLELLLDYYPEAHYVCSQNLFEAQFLTKVDGNTIYLDLGPAADEIPENILRPSVINGLDAITYVFRAFKTLGLPSYTYAGPIALQAGIPAFSEGGRYLPATNLVTVSLKEQTPRGLVLDDLWLKFSSIDSIYEKMRSKLKVSGHEADAPVINDITDINMLYTIIHELGHRVFYRGLRPEARRSWYLIYGAYGFNKEEMAWIALYHQNLMAIKAIEEDKDDPFTEEALASYHSEVAELAALRPDLAQLYQEYIDNGYMQAPLTFSKIVWPSKYARSNADEAFAECFTIFIWWRLFNKPPPRMDAGLSSQELDRFATLFWTYIRTLRPTSLR